MQKSAYIQNLYWVYADYISRLSYERTFSVPSRNVAAFFVSCMFVLLQISNLKKLAVDVNFVNNGQLLFPNFISNRLCLGSTAIKISSKDTIT